MYCNHVKSQQLCNEIVQLFRCWTHNDWVVRRHIKKGKWISLENCVSANVMKRFWTRTKYTKSYGCVLLDVTFSTWVVTMSKLWLRSNKDLKSQFWPQGPLLTSTAFNLKNLFLLQTTLLISNFFCDLKPLF